jgi:hypothetical protein
MEEREERSCDVDEFMEEKSDLNEELESRANRGSSIISTQTSSSSSIISTTTPLGSRPEWGLNGDGVYVSMPYIEA